jgi:FixJ family two-component response regulator
MSGAEERRPVVHVVDDDDAVRGSLNLLLKSAGLVAATHASAEAFLAAYDPERPGCLVLDVRMPGIDGLELQQELNRRGMIIPVIFITGHGDVPMAVEAMQHGAVDFLQKPFRDQDLIERVREALARDGARRAQLAASRVIAARLASLTRREQQVLRLLVRGYSNKRMAGELGVSQRTIEIHRARVMQKMQARSVAQLVRLSLDAEVGTTTY